MTEYFNVKVIKIEDGATYQNQVYDQEVILELENKQKIKFFDHNFEIKKYMLGKKIQVQASVTSVQPKKNSEQKQEIIQTGSTTAKISGKIIFVGKLKLKKYDLIYNEYIIDTNYAKFYNYIKENPKLKKGDYVTFEEFGNGLDIIKVNLMPKKKLLNINK